MLSYALYNEHVAHQDSWKVLEEAYIGKYEVGVISTTILETYNVLFWHYKVRPRVDLLRKIQEVINDICIFPVDLKGISISQERNIPLGDGFLLATALTNSIDVIVSNDSHIKKTGSDLGLVIINPLSRETLEELKEN